MEDMTGAMVEPGDYLTDAEGYTYQVLPLEQEVVDEGTVRVVEIDPINEGVRLGKIGFQRLGSLLKIDVVELQFSSSDIRDLWAVMNRMWLPYRLAEANEDRRKIAHEFRSGQ